MATITSSGAGSGIDVNSLVTQLVAADRAPLEQRITRQEVQVTTRMSALGTLKGALSSFKAALEPLKSLDAFRVRKASSGDEDIFTATASATAQPGKYDIEIDHLAEAHQLSSDAFLAGGTSVVGTGTLTLTVGTQSMSITIDSSNNTLAGIASAINAKPDNPGVRATLVHGVDGSHLVLTSNKTGLSNAIKVAASGGDGGLDQLIYNPAGIMNMNELVEALDSEITVQGITHKSASNVVAGAIDGVTLTLKAETDGPVKLDVGFDSGATLARVNKFVSEFNALQTQIGKLRSYDPATKAAGPMLGDALLSGIESQVRRGLTDSIAGLTGNFQSLASIGIKSTVTGALEVDSAKLQTALDSNFDAVGGIFASSKGIAARLFDTLTTRLGSGAEIASRSNNLTASLKQIEKDKENLDVRMEQIEARYRRQFTALDTLLSRLQTTSSALTQQLANLPKIGG